GRPDSESPWHSHYFGATSGPVYYRQFSGIKARTMELEKTKLFGTDLRLLLDLEFQNSRQRGADLRVTQRTRSGMFDLETLTRADNIKQALLLRFLTPVGEMENLGHPDY